MSENGVERRETVHVEDPPRRILGNLLEEGPDGQCAYVYAGIEQRCQNDAVAHTWFDMRNGSVKVEMCAEHARGDVPEPPRTEQQQLRTDGGENVDGFPGPDIPHGPHTIPRVPCSNCGTEHHPDAARHPSDEYPPQCRECRAFLRRPTPAEEEKFGWFIAWNGRHQERDREEPKLVTDGSGESVDGPERPAFVDPHVEIVECYFCGRVWKPTAVDGFDISDEDEYYPKMVPVCPEHAGGCR